MPLMGRRGGCVCEMRAPSRARRCLFVGLLQAIALACVRPASAHACDRARSRVARKILDAELYSKVDEKGYHLPQSCPFAKEMDMYLDNELHKKEARFGNWRCLYCNKVFKSESYLERHIESRHPATIQADGVCLADYCDVLECDVHETLFQPGQTGESVHCNPKVMQRRRHRCHMVLDQCFPPHGSQIANQLHHDFEHLYCDHLTCETAIDGSLRARQPSAAMQEAASARAEALGGTVKSSGWRKLFLVFGVLFMLMLFIFYLGVCLYRKDMTFVSDLRKLSAGRRQKRMELLKAKQF